MNHLIISSNNLFTFLSTFIIIQYDEKVLESKVIDSFINRRFSILINERFPLLVTAQISNNVTKLLK